MSPLLPVQAGGWPVFTTMKILKSTAPEYATQMRLLSASYAADAAKADRISIAQAKKASESQRAEMLRDGQKTKGNYFYTLHQSGHRVGYLWIIILRDRVFIANLFIFKKYRSSGYGSRAIKWVKKRALRRGLNIVQLHVFGHNERAQALYEALGFRKTNVHMRVDL